MSNSSFNDESWLYNNNMSELKSSYNNETLQEPVPFEGIIISNKNESCIHTSLN